MNHQTTNLFSFTGNEQRVDKLINSLRAGVLLQGPKAEILFSNKAALDMLGLSEDELFGRTSYHPEWNVIREDGSEFKGTDHPVPVSIRTKKPVLNIVMGVYRPATTDRVWLLVNAEPILSETGEVEEVICSFSDITERKLAEEKLHWLYQDLEIRAFELANTNADMERFVYAATHDLQEPLRLISSFTQLLKRKYEKQLDAKALEYIDYAVNGASHLKMLILGLLEFSNLNHSKEKFVSTDMNEVVRKALVKLSGKISEVKAELVVNELPPITAVPSMMQQLMENFVDNALKFRGPSSPIITIDCKEEENQYVFTVSDNGIGIDPDYSDRIFVLFQRLQDKQEGSEGVGAGLAICKKIVSLHHGMIGVSSTKGAGSTFYFTIPKRQMISHEKI